MADEPVILAKTRVEWRWGVECVFCGGGEVVGSMGAGVDTSESVNVGGG